MWEGNIWIRSWREVRMAVDEGSGKGEKRSGMCWLLVPVSFFRTR